MKNSHENNIENAKEQFCINLMKKDECINSISDSGAKTPKQLTHTSTQKLFDNKKWYFIGDIAHYSVPKTIVPLRFSWLFH